jgi:superfamily I DNA and RNA helicase
LGFGLSRDRGMVQHFDEPSLWVDIGYMVEKGPLDYGQDVVLARGPRSYPLFFEKLLTPADAVHSQAFNTKDEQYAWIAEQVARNLKEDELDADDILIVLPEPITQRDEYYSLRRHLDSRGIPSSLAGVTNDRDQFSQSGIVTVSGIYRAKGNEAPMVYIANSDFCVVGHELIRLRNILFTAITRSRAWVRLCGTGLSMTTLQKEIDAVVNSGYKLVFRVPTQEQLAAMRRINRDRTAEEKSQIRKAEKSLEEVLDLVKRGVISPDAMPQLKEILKAMQDKGGKA